MECAFREFIMFKCSSMCKEASVSKLLCKEKALDNLNISGGCQVTVAKTTLGMCSRNACCAEGANGMHKHRWKIGTRLYCIQHDIRLCFEMGHTNLFLAGC